MRLSVIKYEGDEIAHYNPGVFYKKEDLIIFPFKEFDKVYNETIENLNVINDILKNALNSKSANTPKRDLEHLNDWINLVREDMDLLISFDMQTTLESFNSPRKVKNSKKIHNTHLNKKIQCLMGL